MKQQRKEALMYAFPPVPARIQEQMKGKRAQNFCVFLTRGAELFVRCFHRYYHGELIECNRYVFAKDGCVRYLWYGEPGCGDRWRVTRLFREPVFFAPGWYSGRRDNSYVILNADAYKKSEMKYCELDSINIVCPMEYLRLYIRHPNIEYLIKAGYHRLLKIQYNGWYYQIPTVEVSPLVNLKSNNLLKMLDLNRDEFKALRGRENFYDEYLLYRKEFTGYKPTELLEMVTAYHFQLDTLKRHSKQTGVSPLRLARYLNENDIEATMYGDYIAQCEGLGYNLHDTAINMPHDFDAIHNRLSTLIKYKETEELRAAFEISVDRLKAHLLSSMEAVGLKKLDLPRVRISIKNNAESLVVDDELGFIKWAQENADELLKYSAPEIRKSDTKRLVQGGRNIPCVHLTRTKSVIIK